MAAELGRPSRPLGLPGVAYLVNHPESMWRRKRGGSRELDYPSELVWPASARRILADDFASPDLVRASTGATRGFAYAYARAARGRIRTRLGRPLRGSAAAGPAGVEAP